MVAGYDCSSPIRRDSKLAVVSANCKIPLFAIQGHSVRPPRGAHTHHLVTTSTMEMTEGQRRSREGHHQYNIG